MAKKALWEIQSEATQEILKIAREAKLFVGIWDKSDVQSNANVKISDNKWVALLNRFEDDITWSDINDQMAEIINEK